MKRKFKIHKIKGWERSSVISELLLKKKREPVILTTSMYYIKSAISSLNCNIRSNPININIGYSFGKRSLCNNTKKAE